MFLKSNVSPVLEGPDNAVWSFEPREGLII